MMSDMTVMGESGVIDLTVSDPQHHGEGRSKHTSYLIELRSPSVFAMCRRRYSDFQWLYKRLLEEKAGAIIPIIPHRKAITSKVRFSEELVTERQQVLHGFLQKVLTHPELGDAKCLSTFLTADFTSWEVIRKTGGAGNNVEGDGTTVVGGDDDTTAIEDYDKYDGADEDDEEKTLKNSTTGGSSRFSNFMGNLMAKAKLAMGGTFELEATPEDELFEEIDAYFNQIEANVRVLAKEAPAYVASTKSQADNLEKMAASWAAMGEYRFNSDSISVKTNSAELFAKLSQHFTSFCRLQHNLHEKQIGFFETPILELNRDVQALKIALQQRKEALFEYSRKASQGKTKMNQVDRLKDIPNSSLDKIHALEGELAVLKDEGLGLWKIMDTISKRLQRDVERFKVETHKKLQTAMQQYCNVSGECSQRTLEEYKKMAGTVGLLSGGDDGKAPKAENGDGETDKEDGPVTASL